MLRTVLIVASAVVLLAVGAMTAAAGNRHANSAGLASGAGAVTTLTTGAMLEVKAQDNEEQAQAAASAAARAQSQTQAQAETDSDTADEATDETTDEDASDATDEAAPAAAPATNNEQKGAEHDD